MGKIAVVYWSGTGNTEAMANGVTDGAKEAGAQVDMMTAGDFSADQVDTYAAIAFGCPSMGDEILEEDEFQPMWDQCAPRLGGKKIALFGSYGWGDGEWMRNWTEECKGLGAQMAAGFLIVNETLGDEDIEQCKKLGKSLVS